MSGGGAVANIIRPGDETGLRQKIAIAESLGSLVGRDEQYLPQLARSSQPLRRSDSIMLSTALELAPSSLNVFTRNAL
jgi:hypothetical protein